jgi:hypothetical protein
MSASATDQEIRSEILDGDHSASTQSSEVQLQRILYWVVRLTLAIEALNGKTP